ncbi:MAG: beta-N-acetylhexosaminidase [Parvibaculum sp.]|uniref:beta-N-acetylhexosaminidase n=1 Tax=Parvibaculum sp. TaxID=2024848 RepID=UPI0032ECD8A8
MSVSAAIYGCAGLVLDEAERAFFRAARPWAFILFARNIDTPEQVRRLIASLRDAAGHNAQILIDQEGGRVQRLRPPHWHRYPPGRAYGAIHAANPEAGLAAARLGARLIAEDLRDLGITVDCLPVLDVPVAGADDVIGDRAYAQTPDDVAVLGRVAAEGLLAGGVLPVMKHIPGHGRAGVDSHKSLPVVSASRRELEETDFPPFHALCDLPLAMTAHVVYTAIDPDAPATTSKKVIGQIVRGQIGFDGLLMSDDLSMEALAGDLGARARSSLAAGCDVVLHCNGRMAEMEAVAGEAPALAGAARARAESAEAMRLLRAEALDPAENHARLAEFLAAYGQDRWG